MRLLALLGLLLAVPAYAGPLAAGAEADHYRREGAGFSRAGTVPAGPSGVGAAGGVPSSSGFAPGGAVPGAGGLGGAWQRGGNSRASWADGKRGGPGRRGGPRRRAGHGGGGRGRSHVRGHIQHERGVVGAYIAGSAHAYGGAGASKPDSSERGAARPFHGAPQCGGRGGSAWQSPCRGVTSPSLAHTARSCCITNR